MKPGPKIPQIPIEEFRTLCAFGATDVEIAHYFGVSQKTIQRMKDDPTWAAAYENGRAKMKISLRRAQLEAAYKGNATMLIWLGKQLLGQRDEVDILNINGDGTPDRTSRDAPALEHLASSLARLAARKAKASGPAPDAEQGTEEPVN